MYVYSFHSVQAQGTIMGYPEATETTENLLTAKCDILIPAAGEKQITASIAKDIQAKVPYGQHKNIYNNNYYYTKNLEHNN